MERHQFYANSQILQTQENVYVADIRVFSVFFSLSAFKSNQLKVGLHKRVRSRGHAILNLGPLSGLMSQKAKVGTSIEILIGY